MSNLKGCLRIHPNIWGTCEYIEEITADKQQGVIIAELGSQLSLPMKNHHVAKCCTWSQTCKSVTRLAEDIAHMGEMPDDSEDLGVDGRIILKRISRQ
jgi:hypothetical protein